MVFQETNDISTCHFYPRADGHAIRRNLEEHGQLLGPSECLSQELGVAVSSSEEVAAGTSTEYLFSLVWDMPEIRFGLKERTYRRFVTSSSLNIVEILIEDTQDSFLDRDLLSPLLATRWRGSTTGRKPLSGGKSPF